jgi:hypothetical protein
MDGWWIGGWVDRWMVVFVPLVDSGIRPNVREYIPICLPRSRPLLKFNY